MILKTKILLIGALVLLLTLNLNATNLKIKKIIWKNKKIEVVDRTVLVTLESISKIKLINKMDSLNIKIIYGPDDFGVTQLQIPENIDLNEEIAKIKKIKGLKDVEPDVITHEYVDPDDQYYYNQWAHPLIDSPEAWDIETGSSNIIVGVLDSGIPLQNDSLSHTDLNNSNRILLGNDYTNSGNGVKDDRGHGTHVAGILSAETDNGIIIAGMSWYTKLFIVKVLDLTGHGSSLFFYRGVHNAVDNGAKVINFSAGSSSGSSYYTSAINYARNHGCLIVASAGNDASSVSYPARYSSSYDNVIAVSATNSSDQIASFSNTGSQINVAAPGVHILSTMPNYHVALNDSGYSQNFAYMDGTSQAAPHVSGLAALILSKDGTLSPLQVRVAIETSAIDLGTQGFDNEYGHGRINANNAVRNLYVPAVYPTISSAMSKATAGQQVIVKSGTQTLTGNVTIPTGITLTLSSVATINLNGHSIISTGGTINTQSGVTINGLRATTPYIDPPFNGLFGSIQTAVNNHHLGVINIKSGTFQESISISNDDDGIMIYGDWRTGDTQIRNICLYNNSSSIIFSDMTARCVSIYNCSQPLFYYFNVLPWSPEEDYSFFATNSGYWWYGMELGKFSLNGAYDGTGAVFYNSEGKITNNSEFIYNYLATAFSMGSDFTISNSYFCLNNLDIYASSNSEVNCYSVTFSGDPNVKTQGNVNWYGYSTCGLAKSIADEIHLTEENIFKKIEPVNDEKSEKFRESIDSLKNFLNDNIKSLTPDAAKMTFRKLINLYKKYDMEEMKLYLQEVIDNGNLQNLSIWAKRHLIDYYNYKREFQNSLAIADEILLNENETDPIMVCESLFEKGLIYVYALPDKYEAAYAFKELVTKYPESPLAKAAKKELSRIDKNYQEKIQTNTNSLEEKGLSIDNNPNPFNPITTIQYNLPKDENVILEVFDIQGQKVKTLVNGFKEAGYYEVIFDGSQLASGVYIYKIKAGNFSSSKRMLLIK